MKKKFLLVALLVSGFLGSSVATVASADDDYYLPEYGTLAEHNQWSTKAITVDKVAELGIRGAGVKIAVLDSGIALNTPGINTKLFAYKDFVPSQQPLPDHGTQTASVIVSDFDATTGLRGVAPEAQLIVGRVCHMSSCDSAAARKAIRWAIDQGAQVISMSFGGPADALMNATMSSAVEEGVVIVSSAGNNGCQPIATWGLNRFCKQGVISEGYSASYTIPGLISVGAIDQTRARASFSSWGPNLDLMAPGVNNVTYDPAGATNGFGGTSAATPLVAGVAALVLSVNPNLSPQEVQAILQGTTSPAISKKPKVWDSCQQSPETNAWTCNNQVENDFPQEYFTGAGVVDALAAVKLTEQLTQGKLLQAPVVTVAGTEMTVTWTGGNADLYVNNKLVKANASSGFVISGGDAQSYSLQIRREDLLSQPSLVVLQNPITPSAPIVTEVFATSNELRVSTTDLVSELDQLKTSFNNVGAVFEYEDGRRIPCSGYSPSIGDAEKVYSFLCPSANLVAPLNGSFRLLNKYSRLGPGAPLAITTVNVPFKTIDVTTTYLSSDEIVFDWGEVAGALSYAYRYLPSGEFSCTTESVFSLKGKGTQPSVFLVEARLEENCGGNKIAESEYQPYVLLSPKPQKPSGITVKSNELTHVEFEVANSQPTDQWRIYRSDGAVTRIPAGQKIVLGMQPNENVNGKTFSYRIMQVINDTWGEVWSEPSDPIAVTIKPLEAPKEGRCEVRSSQANVECLITPNHEVDSTLIEYLDINGDVLSTARLKNVSDTNQQLEKLTSNFSFVASFVRLSAITGKPNEWMRRGDSATVKVRNRSIGIAYVTL